MNKEITPEQVAELIAQERKEQIEKHRRSIENDAQFNTSFQLIDGAKKLLFSGSRHGTTEPPGWDIQIWMKMVTKPYKERLIIAGALIAAEIDRLNHTTNE